MPNLQNQCDFWAARVCSVLGGVCGSLFHPHWEWIVLQRTVMETGFQTGLEQSSSVRCAEMGLPASSATLDPPETSRAPVAESNIYHIHQFSAKWKCWHDTDNVMTHLPNLHRVGRISLCFQYWARVGKSWVQFRVSHRLFVWGSEEDLISLHLKCSSMKQG